MCVFTLLEYTYNNLYVAMRYEFECLLSEMSKLIATHKGFRCLRKLSKKPSFDTRHRSGASEACIQYKIK